MIRDEDVQHWRDHGYVVLERFLNPEEMQTLTKATHKHMPDWNEYKTREPIYATYNGKNYRQQGSGARLPSIQHDFPYCDDALNNLALHPFLVAFAERISDSKDLLMSISSLTGKYAGRSNYDQPLHSDYQNNTGLLPGKNSTWLNMPMIIYLSDVLTEDDTPTYVVSQTHTEPMRLMETGLSAYSREDFPGLYELETPVLVPAGSVIIYSMRTIHRGSEMTAKEGCRFVLFGGFHTANAQWMSPKTYAGLMGSPNMNNFLVHADPAQRALIGMPPVGHDYWKDPDVIEGVANRYPDMDMRPYTGGPPNSS